VTHKYSVLTVACWRQLHDL